jgi:hypothetical protein
MLAQHSRFPFVIHTLFVPHLPFLLGPGVDSVDQDLACDVRGTSLGHQPRSAGWWVTTCLNACVIMSYVGLKSREVTNTTLSPLSMHSVIEAQSPC